MIPIALATVGSAIATVRAMAFPEKERLVEELFPPDILLVCLRAMKESGLKWPLIT